MAPDMKWVLCDLFYCIFISAFCWVTECTEMHAVNSIHSRVYLTSTNTTQNFTCSTSVTTYRPKL